MYTVVSRLSTQLDLNKKIRIKPGCVYLTISTGCSTVNLVLNAILSSTAPILRLINCFDIQYSYIGNINCKS
jgi:hypothetical protein